MSPFRRFALRPEPSDRLESFIFRTGAVSVFAEPALAYRLRGPPGSILARSDIAQVFPGILVLGGHDVGGDQDLLVLLRRIHQWVDHDGVAAGEDGERDKGVVKQLPPRQAEGNVAESAEDVHLGEGLAQHLDRVEEVVAEVRAGADGEDQRVQEAVLHGQAHLIHKVHAAA